MGDPQWLWPAVALLLAALAVLVWGYRQARGGRGTLAPATLKAVALALLAAFLVNPLWSTQRAQPRANLFVTLIDNSRSLRISDADATITRAEALRTLLTGKADKSPATGEVATWSMRLAEEFDARSYSFDTRLRSLTDPKGLTFDGRGSALLASLRSIADRYRGRPLAGVLLFTDGNATDVAAGGREDASVALDLAGLPPVYPVVVGGERSRPDVGIASLAVSQTAFEDAPVTVAAEVSATGFAGRAVMGELVDEAGSVVRSQALKVDGDDKTLALRFQVKPMKAGVTFYTLRVREESAAAEGGGASVAAEVEATVENNTRLIAVDRGGGPYRVLYVCGRPNWEYKFLARAVAADPQVQLVGLIRMAKREAKFAWRDNLRGETNPLFRGFKGGDSKDKEQVESFDEPVLVRIGTLDDAELRGGFPKTADDLFKYHAIVLDDLEAAFFTRDQLALLERFVTDRRGGLLMLGGAESLREGDYHRTPIGRLLPVYLDRAPDEGASAAGAAKYRLELTRPGWHEPWARLRGTEEEERKRIAAMPAFLTLNRVPPAGIKPGATVLIEAVDEQGGRWPALVTQPFGGRVAVSTIGDAWRWSLKREELESDDAGKMWRQTVRWLVADVPGRVTASADAVRGAGDAPMRLRVTVRDREFKPLDNAKVTIKVTPPVDPAKPQAMVEAIELRGEASLSEAGVYEVTYLPRGEGAYRAAVDATDADGKPVDTAELGWTHGEAAEEMRSLKPNRALLESIAKQTGGEVVTMDGLDAFVAALPAKKAPVMETTIEPLWHRWWALAMAVGLLVGEWTLRRVRGLP